MGFNNQQSSLLPFQGLRFTRDLSNVLGPPADIDSSDEARAFVAGRPHNAVRLEMEDHGAELRFHSARELLRRWRTSRVLSTDPRPVYYVYEQEFDDAGFRRVRRGVFGLVPLDAPDVCVLPHEETWEENRQRRLQLLRDLDAGISPVFLIYEGQETARLLAEIARRPPDEEAGDDAGNTHRLWVVSDPAEIARIRSSMRDRHHIIADGHHRFAAAQLFHAERQSPETACFLACCVEAGDPGIVIRPIHRVVRPPTTVCYESLLTKLNHWFSVTETTIDAGAGDDLARLLPSGDTPSIGLILDGGARFVIVRLHDWAGVAPLLPGDIPDTVRQLDVTIVTELLLRQVFEITAEDEPEFVSYVHEAGEALDAVQRQPDTLAVLLRPIPLDQVMAIARSGGTVPVKSTSFFPKIPIGLVLHGFEVSDE